MKYEIIKNAASRVKTSYGTLKFILHNRREFKVAERCKSRKLKNLYERRDMQKKIKLSSLARVKH